MNFDACCNDESGSDSKCSNWGSQDDFLVKDVAGKHVWSNASFARMPAFIKQYLDCKAKNPHHTCACIVVPKGAGHWKHLLSATELLTAYDKGECMLVDKLAYRDVCGIPYSICMSGGC